MTEIAARRDLAQAPSDAFGRWFLSSDERGNRSTRIDDGSYGAQAWTENNHVIAHVDGAGYLSRLAIVLGSLSSCDEVRFTDWRGDADEVMDRGGKDLATILSEACTRGVDVRGLLWRSHSDRLSFNAQENRELSRIVNRAGGETLLDERVRPGGCHHQKLVVVRSSDPQRDVAFVGGIDLGHGRRDDSSHLGDPQAIKLDSRYGPRPAWHDVQLEIAGPAVGTLDDTFRERWEDPTPLNHSTRLRGLISHSFGRDRTVAPLPPRRPEPSPAGTHAVQVLRTYPSTRPRYPFAAHGERSVARAFCKAVGRARSLIYIEDQYFWSLEIARVLATALKRQPALQVVVLVPRYPDNDGRLSGPPARTAQSRAMQTVLEAGGARVGFYDLANDVGRPVYVHAKVCVIDDVWATVGSDNLNRRSWTHDSELSCAVVDGVLDDRAPQDPGGLGDGARRFARELRLSLWAEHLGRAVDDPELLDLAHGAALWRDASVSTTGTPARVRQHDASELGRPAPWARVLYRMLLDPDGRSLFLRLRGAF